MVLPAYIRFVFKKGNASVNIPGEIQNVLPRTWNPQELDHLLQHINFVLSVDALSHVVLTYIDPSEPLHETCVIL
jgi:hypothetical protein